MSVILSSTTDKVEMVTSSTADIDYETFYVVADKTTPPMSVTNADSKVGTVASATTTDITGSPAAANDRWSVCFDIRNRHATISNTIILRVVKAAGTARELISVTLFAGWKLTRDKSGHWFVYDQNGAVVMGNTAASDTQAGLIQLAVQADMESASSTTLAVTPGRQHFHPGTAKVWGVVTVASGTPSLVASYGLASITDTATGELTITFTTAFSSVNYMVTVSAELTATSYAVANDRKPYVRFSTRATTGLTFDCIDSTATTNLLKDPQAWYFALHGDF